MTHIHTSSEIEREIDNLLTNLTLTQEGWEVITSHLSPTTTPPVLTTWDGEVTAVMGDYDGYREEIYIAMCEVIEDEFANLPSLNCEVSSPSCERINQSLLRETIMLAWDEIDYHLMSHLIEDGEEEVIPSSHPTISSHTYTSWGEDMHDIEMNIEEVIG